VNSEALDKATNAAHVHIKRILNRHPERWCNRPAQLVDS
jgi:hypothetical protein